MAQMARGIGKAAVIGGGVIGGGWAARLINAGCAVSVFDPNPDAAAGIEAVLARNHSAQLRLWPGQAPRRGKIHYATSIAEAVAGAELVQESVPERMELKQAVHAEIGAALESGAVVGSSTSGLLPSVIQKNMPNGDRMLAAHPYNPVYLLPVVEIVGGDRTAPDAIVRALEIYGAIGMVPVHIKKEIDAFVGDRLLEAMWRESLWLVSEGVASVGEIDDVVRYGLGLRFAQMGQFMTYRLGGGAGGFRHFLEQFAPSLTWPWTRLMDVPEWNDALVERIVAESDAHAEGLSVDELERIRDNNLVDFLKVLAANDWGAGRALQNPVAASLDETMPEKMLEEMFDGDKLVPWRGRVEGDWTDYNNHMTEYRYLHVFSLATDELLLACGGGAGYVAQGFSFYTAETHIRHIDEVAAGAEIYVETRVFSDGGKKLHLFHAMYAVDGAADGGQLLATGEHLLLHVDMGAGRAVPMPASIAEAFARISDAQARRELPQGMGAGISMNKTKKATN